LGEVVYKLLRQRLLDEKADDIPLLILEQVALKLLNILTICIKLYLTMFLSEFVREGWWWYVTERVWVRHIVCTRVRVTSANP
jgi:glycopeptide antibiotics resistance protein